MSQNDHSKRTFFDSHSASVPAKSVAPESDQLEHESRRLIAGTLGIWSITSKLRRSPIYRLWSKVTAAIKAKDLDAATDAKSTIEDAQREKAAKGATPKAHYFKQVDGEWTPDITFVSYARFPSHF